ncbi:MAG: glycosyltransferase [Deltaproteobacteria bacterium]|nr:glycosyltransferase [Deltaproteobacteria bacterium]
MKTRHTRVYNVSVPYFPLLVALVWVGLAWVTRSEHRRMPRLTGRLPRPVERARVLAIVPARDEETCIASCLRSLVAQQGVDLRVAVYDDRSHDGTAARALEVAEQSEGRVTLYRGTAEPPPGWCGKPHALVRAMEAAGYNVMSGRMADDVAPHALLFVDADVVLRPTAVAEMAELVQEQGLGLASALPHLVCRSFWEHVAGPSVGGLVTARHRPSQVNDPDHAAVLANGQFMMVTPEAYAAVGGHEAVKSLVLEDVALAELVKRQRRRVALADGQAVCSTRMYESLGELWQGWSKNAYRLVGGTPGKVTAYALASLLLGASPTFCGVVAAWLAWSGTGAPLPWVAGYVVPLAMQASLRRLGGQPPGYALFAPLGAAVVCALLLKSTWTALRGGSVTWKGRAYRDGTGVSGR